MRHRPTIKVVTNTDEEVILSCKQGRDCKWYKFKNGGKNIEDLKRVVSKISSGTATPGQNFIIDGMSVSVCPPRSQSSEYVMLQETPEMYNKYVKGHIKCPKWISKIEQGLAETENIISETPDYYLLPDVKWDRKVPNLYLLLIFKDTSLGSIRDLTAEHLPLLERVRAQVLRFIEGRYGLPANNIRCFFHYMPSAWRLHMHIQHVSSTTALGSGTQCGRARLLNEVMSNINLIPDYYQRASLECVLNRERYDMYYGSCQET
jgi:hypothetical protein